MSFWGPMGPNPPMLALTLSYYPSMPLAYQEPTYLWFLATVVRLRNKSKDQASHGRQFDSVSDGGRAFGGGCFRDIPGTVDGVATTGKFGSGVPCESHPDLS